MKENGQGHKWRLQTNFVEPKNIVQSFGVWPDDVLSPSYLEELYSGNATRENSPFTCKTDQGIRPSFPFLDRHEGERIAALFERRKYEAYPYLDMLFAKPLSPNSPEQLQVGCILPVMQALSILELRNREKELGIWERRSESQKVGTLYALRPCETSFARVEVIPFGENDILSVPWGGPFNDYSKILELLESPHTAQVLASANEKNEVVPNAFVMKHLLGAGLIREIRKGLLDTNWQLTVPTVNGRDMKGMILAALPLVRDLSHAVQDVLPALIPLIESGRYSYLSGTGDYMEMSYSVLMGLVLEWAMQDGLLDHPPQYEVVRTERGIHEVSTIGKRRGAPAVLPGVIIVRNAYDMWDDLLTVIDAPEGRS